MWLYTAEPLKKKRIFVLPPSSALPASNHPHFTNLELITMKSKPQLRHMEISLWSPRPLARISSHEELLPSVHFESGPCQLHWWSVVLTLWETVYNQSLCAILSRPLIILQTLVPFLGSLHPSGKHLFSSDILLVFLGASPPYDCSLPPGILFLFPADSSPVKPHQWSGSSQGTVTMWSPSHDSGLVGGAGCLQG